MQSCDFAGQTCVNAGAHVWSEVCTTNGLFNTVFKVCVFPLLNVVRNRTKIAPWRAITESDYRITWSGFSNYP
jgi:hypothetical protein